MDEIELVVLKKNSAAVKQALDDMNSRLYAQQERIDGLVATLSTITAKLNDIELKYNIQRAKAFGHGATQE